MTSSADLCWKLGGIICNFTPILPYFQHWGRWTSTTILCRCGNLVKTKRLIQIEHFFFPNSGEDKKTKRKKVFFKNRTLFLPEFRWRQKKRSSAKIEHFFLSDFRWRPKKRSSARIEHFFPQIYAQLYTHSNYWGDANVDHSLTIGGIQPNYWGGYIPHSPGFGTPAYDSQ